MDRWFLRSVRCLTIGVVLIAVLSSAARAGAAQYCQTGSTTPVQSSGQMTSWDRHSARAGWH